MGQDWRALMLSWRASFHSRNPVHRLRSGWSTNLIECFERRAQVEHGGQSLAPFERHRVPGERRPGDVTGSVRPRLSLHARCVSLLCGSSPRRSAGSVTDPPRVPPSIPESAAARSYNCGTDRELAFGEITQINGWRRIGCTSPRGCSCSTMSRKRQRLRCPRRAPARGARPCSRVESDRCERRRNRVPSPCSDDLLDRQQGGIEAGGREECAAAEPFVTCVHCHMSPSRGRAGGRTIASENCARVSYRRGSASAPLLRRLGSRRNTSRTSSTDAGGRHGAGTFGS